jgi:hypothetical protein
MALPAHITLGFRILPHLIDCAVNGRRTNVDELSAFVDGKTRLFGRALQWIRDYVCVQHNLPPLTVIMVHNGRDTASNSFSPAHINLSREEYEKLRAEKLEEVFAYPRWPAVGQALQDMRTLA